MTTPDWTRTEHDSVKHAIGELFEFFDKKLTDTKLRYWLEDLSSLSPTVAIRAINQSRRQCEYFPKPAVVLRIAAEFGLHARGGATYQPQPPPSQPQIQSAFMIFMDHVHGKSMFTGQPAVEMSFEDARLIVNQIYQKFPPKDVNGNIDLSGIPPKHRLPEVWEKHPAPRDRQAAF